MHLITLYTSEHIIVHIEIKCTVIGKSKKIKRKKKRKKKVVKMFLRNGYSVPKYFPNMITIIMHSYACIKVTYYYNQYQQKIHQVSPKTGVEHL